MKKVGVLIGALLAAVAASACCILPAILGVASAGTVGLGAAVAPFRPYLMGLTVLMLGAGFYFTYRPAKADCGTDGCAPGEGVLAKRLGRVVLWAVTIFTVGAMAFPWIAAQRVRAAETATPAISAPVAAQTATFTVDKMSCAECSQQIAAALRKLPGVYSAKVDFDTKRATVRYDVARIGSPQLQAAIDRTGYPAKGVTAPHEN